MNTTTNDTTYADLYNELRETELSLTQTLIALGAKALPDAARNMIRRDRDRISALLERTGTTVQVMAGDRS